VLIISIKRGEEVPHQPIIINPVICFPESIAPPVLLSTDNSTVAAESDHNQLL
jgi:hypothetical protein